LQTGAKINLGLAVTGKIDGQYHQVETVMTKLPLYDDLIIEWQPHSSTIKIICDHDQVPRDSSNLIHRALSLLQRDFSLPGAQVTLRKNIPVGAGLGGGGSFNAGALLKALNSRLHLGLTPSQLLQTSLSLGSDCAFAATDYPTVYEQHHGLANLAQTPLPCLPACQIALVFFPIFLSTSTLYHHLDALHFTPSPIAPLLTAIRRQSLPAIAAHLENDFTHYVYARYPQLLAARQQLLTAGALGVGLSGKGPTLFALFPPDLPLHLPLAATILRLPG
jgi:4-diphosphocytidyl-2-C-methyl-D-erythritol kinase